MGILRVFKRLREDIDSVMQRDPAAESRLEVILTYPGLHAIMGYRLARKLWNWKLTLPALLVSYVARAITGIEIHPGARIGRRFFIDHGTGVVIGGTAEIGDDVTLYQGVTLGGTSLLPGKRHPTLGNGVIVGANATILGPVKVGDNARVGANAVVLKDVPEGCTAVGVPARIIWPQSRTRPGFLPYGTPCEDLPDPVARAIRGLVDEVTALRQRVEAMEAERGPGGAADGLGDADGLDAEGEDRQPASARGAC
jgi:serine O-acetyltransferase